MLYGLYSLTLVFTKVPTVIAYGNRTQGLVTLAAWASE